MTDLFELVFVLWFGVAFGYHLRPWVDKLREKERYERADDELTRANK